jgi:glycosyltransferase involved in cell wall biosynthesis
VSQLCQFVAVGPGVAECRQCHHRKTTHHAPERINRRCPKGVTIARVTDPAPAGAQQLAADDPEWWPKDANGNLIPQADITAADMPCPHRGEQIENPRVCDTCGQRGQPFDLFACATHGTCSMTLKHTAVANCLRCPTRFSLIRNPLGTLPVIGATVAKPKRTGPVRVSYITPTMGMGGAERWILALCKAWSDGTEVAVKCIALTSGGQSWEPFCREAVRAGVPVYGSTQLHPSQPNAAEFIQRFDDAKEPLRRATTDVDVVLHWGIHSIGDLLRSVGYSGPSVSVSHGSLAATRPLLEAAASGSTHFAAVSQKAAEAYPEHLWPRVETLWNGCEVDRIVPTRSRDLVRAEWGCDPNDLLIGHVGRLAFDKNPLAVAHAAVALQPRMPDRRVRPVWVGNGWQAAEVRREAVAIAGDACVWVDPPTHLGDAWGAIDAYVLASDREGFALALCEALLCGVPTVATPVGCVPEIEARFGQAVVTVPVSPTRDQLADALEVALSSEHRPTVKRARQIVWEHFTGAAMARRWTEHLKATAFVSSTSLDTHPHAKLKIEQHSSPPKSQFLGT